MTLICQSHYVLDKDYEVFNRYCLGDTCEKKLLTNFTIDMGYYLKKTISICLLIFNLDLFLCLVPGFLTSVDCLCGILMCRSFHHFISSIIQQKFKIRFTGFHLNTLWKKLRINLDIYTLGIYLSI